MHKYWLILWLCPVALLAPGFAQKYHHVVLPAPPAPAQTGTYGGQFPSQEPQRSDPAEMDAEHQREKQANKDRQASLKKDTDQLFKLASELKSSVDKSTEYTLSLQVIKKADEIERLAKSVKDKMKASSYQPLAEPGGR